MQLQLAEVVELQQRHVWPGTPPRVRKVPIQAAQAAATAVAVPPAAAAEAGFDIAALAAEAHARPAATFVQHSIAEMGGDVPYGSRPTAGYVLTVGGKTSARVLMRAIVSIAKEWAIGASALLIFYSFCGGGLRRTSS